ncbi:MAG: methyl-viologen-reducing hydrogenase subunit delta, partial [Planctomycetota bacterium]
EGARFAEVMSDFAGQLSGLGPVGEETADLPLKLAALTELVPWIKLVEREKLRVPTRSDEAYREWYASEETGRLIDELFSDRIAIGQALGLLRQKPHSTRDMAERLGLSASDISRHMNESSRRGLVTFDVDSKCYVLA